MRAGQLPRRAEARRHRLRALLAAALLGLGLCGGAAAHKGSDAYLDVRAGAPDGAAAAGQAQPLQLRLSVALRDLDQVVAVDADSDARITWGEVQAATPAILTLLDGAVQVDGVGAGAAPSADCVLRWQRDGLEQRGDGVYLRAVAPLRCPAGTPVQLRYRLFAQEDASHRLLVAGTVDGAALLATMAPQQDAPVRLRDGTARAATHGASRWNTLAGYFGLGMHHLLEGYDHLAFLLALVLPLHLRLWRQRGVGAGAAAAPGTAWWALLRTVTAFTIGHSVTLVLASLGHTQASPAWVEPVIALSVALAAALNLRPQRWLRVEPMALVFGLVHGYGFAGLLAEAAAPEGLLPWALAGFNLGVEAGQLLAVAGWVLAMQWFVSRPWYDRVVVRGGSVLLIGLSTVWFWQRVA